MYAVIETGSKQYKVAKDDIILVEKLHVKAGGSIKLDKVLLAKDGNSVHVGKPYIKGAHVLCESLGNIRSDKLIAFKYKKRKNYRRKVGHRQRYSRVQITEIGKGAK